jgi:hypothetical protein
VLVVSGLPQEGFVDLRVSLPIGDVDAIREAIEAFELERGRPTELHVRPSWARATLWGVPLHIGDHMAQEGWFVVVGGAHRAVVGHRLPSMNGSRREALYAQLHEALSDAELEDGVSARVLLAELQELEDGRAS